MMKIASRTSKVLKLFSILALLGMLGGCAAQDAHKAYFEAEQLVREAIKRTSPEDPTAKKAFDTLSAGQIQLLDARYDLAMRNFREAKRLSRQAIEDARHSTLPKPPADLPAASPLPSESAAPSPAKAELNTLAETSAVAAANAAKAAADTSAPPTSAGGQEVFKFPDPATTPESAAKPAPVIAFSSAPVPAPAPAAPVAVPSVAPAPATPATGGIALSDEDLSEPTKGLPKESVQKFISGKKTAVKKEAASKKTAARAAAAEASPKPETMVAAVPVPVAVEKKTEKAEAAAEATDKKEEAALSGKRRQIPGTIGFIDNDPSILNEAMTILNQTSKFLLENPSTTLVLQGILAAGEAKTLTAARYDSIRAYLSGKGVPDDQIKLEDTGKRGKSPEFQMFVIEH